jgi:hypothetical protein
MIDLTATFPTEGGRIAFYLERDGVDGAIKAMAQIHKLYRLSIKFGLAKTDPRFHRTYVLSTIDTRRFLKLYATPAVYREVLTAIKYS